MVRAKLEADSGQLDAAFAVAIPATGKFSITLESSGGATGGQPPRNPDYARALEEILERSVRVASTLDDCLVVSRVAQGLSADERRVMPRSPYRFPISLDSLTDFADLRLALTVPQAAIASRASSGGGNNRKAIELTFTSRSTNFTVEDILSAFDATEVPAARRGRKDMTVGLTFADIDCAMAEWRTIEVEEFHAKYGTKHALNFLIVDPEGREYDAKAIAVAARKHAGLDGESADFDADRQTVVEPLERLGYLIEDLTHVYPDDESESDLETGDPDQRARYIAQAKDFLGKTDGKAERTSRREQRVLRKALGLGQGSHECALCGSTYPDRLLVAAHIKKRSECSDEERVDIPAVAMIACTLGCDALFEHGFVVVDDGGSIASTGRASKHPQILEAVSRLKGRKVLGFDLPSRAYFAWHRDKWSKP